MNLVTFTLKKLSEFDISQIRLNDYLTNVELSKLSKYKKQKDAAAFCIGRILTRTTLANLLNMRPKDIPLEIGEHGKPFCPLKNSPQFSISHCDSLVGLAFSKMPIGIDIELKNQAFKAEWSDQILNEFEDLSIQNMAESDRENERIKLFTVKEAYLKMLGVGFLVDPKNITLLKHSEKIWEAHYPQLMEGKILLNAPESEWIIAISIVKSNAWKNDD